MEAVVVIAGAPPTTTVPIPAVAVVLLALLLPSAVVAAIDCKVGAILPLVVLLLLLFVDFLYIYGFDCAGGGFVRKAPYFVCGLPVSSLTPATWGSDRETVAAAFLKV